MPYIGTQPLTGQFKKLDAITVVNGRDYYTMQYNGSNYKPATASALLVSVNGVIQAAGDAYDIDGSTITFTENLVTGDTIDFIIALGDTGSAVTPVDGSVTTAKLANDAITTAKITDGAVTESKVSADIGLLTEYDMWRLSANTSLSNDDTISSNLERVDTDGFEKIGTGMSQSSGVWTFPSTGFYVVKMGFTAKRSGSNVSDIGILMRTSTDGGSTWSPTLDVPSSGADGHHAHGFGEFLCKVTNTSNFKVEFNFQTGGSSGTSLLGDTARNFTYFIFTKIKDA